MYSLMLLFKLSPLPISMGNVKGCQEIIVCTGSHANLWSWLDISEFKAGIICISSSSFFLLSISILKIKLGFSPKELPLLVAVSRRILQKVQQII